MKAGLETVLRAFVEHTLKLRKRFDSLGRRGPVTAKMVGAHHDWQKIEIARFDGWLSGAGWTRAEMFDALRDVVRRMALAERGPVEFEPEEGEPDFVPPAPKKPGRRSPR